MELNLGVETSHCLPIGYSSKPFINHRIGGSMCAIGSFRNI